MQLLAERIVGRAAPRAGARRFPEDPGTFRRALRRRGSGAQSGVGSPANDVHAKREITRALGWLALRELGHHGRRFRDELPGAMERGVPDTLQVGEVVVALRNEDRRVAASRSRATQACHLSHGGDPRLACAPKRRGGPKAGAFTHKRWLGGHGATAWRCQAVARRVRSVLLAADPAASLPSQRRSAPVLQTQESWVCRLLPAEKAGSLRSCASLGALAQPARSGTPLVRCDPRKEWRWSAATRSTGVALPGLAPPQRQGRQRATAAPKSSRGRPAREPHVAPALSPRPRAFWGAA